MGGVHPSKAKWFFVELHAETTGWVFSKSGDPQRVIATLELLGSLLCLVAFDFRASEQCRGIQTISGTTDNQGNSFALQKFMSTKWPLAPLLCELSEQLRSRSLELHLEWQRRDRNKEADAITNQDFSAIRPENRIEIDFVSLPWIVLNQAMVWSKEVYDIAQTAKLKRSGQPFVQPAVWKRKKTAAAERLKATDPW